MTSAPLFAIVILVTRLHLPAIAFDDGREVTAGDQQLGKGWTESWSESTCQ